MAYNVRNINVLDLRPSIGVGVALPFNPSFGAGLRGKLFEQITVSTTDDLDNQIRLGMQQYFPNVVITDLTFGGDPNQNLLTIQFSYIINNTGESDNVIINLNG